MPRSKKTVYDRIEDKKRELIAAQNVVESIKASIQALEKERDDQEMLILFNAMRGNNIEFKDAIKMMENKSK